MCQSVHISSTRGIWGQSIAWLITVFIINLSKPLKVMADDRWTLSHSHHLSPSFFFCYLSPAYSAWIAVKQCQPHSYRLEVKVL